MLLEEMQDEVQEILGETVAADFWSADSIDRRLNQALRRFVAAERWPWLITEGTGTLEADDPEMTLVEGIAATRHLNVTLIPQDTPTRRYSPVQVSAPQGFAMRNTYGTATVSEPEYFYIQSASSQLDDGEFIYVVRFVGTPNQDIDVEYQYYRNAPAMETGDEPDIPEEFHMALVHYAAARAWEKELGQDSAKAKEQDELYAYVLDQARTEWLQQTEDKPLIVGGAPPQYGGPGTRESFVARVIPELLG